MRLVGQGSLHLFSSDAELEKLLHLRRPQLEPWRTRWRNASFASEPQRVTTSVKA